MIRIIHCISKLKSGGAQTQLIHLLNNLDKSIFDVYVLCWDKESALVLNSDVNILEIKKGNIFNLVYNIFVSIKRCNPSIIHVWLPEIMAVPAAFCGLILNVPVVSSERRIPTLKFSKLYLRDRIKYLSHLFSNKVITNFNINFSNRFFFKFLFKRRNGEVIFNGIDIDYFSNFLKIDTYNPNSNKLKLLYVGRLAKHKNIDLLLDAISILKNNLIYIDLTIIGEGEEYNFLVNKTSRLNLESSVSFLGFDNNWSKNAYKYDFFILPSNLEGMPNVLFEASALRLPILASNIPEINSHFIDGLSAFLFKPNSIESIVRVIKFAFFNPNLSYQIQEKAFQLVKNYSIKEMTTKYQNIYFQVIKS